MSPSTTHTSHLKISSTTSSCKGSGRVAGGGEVTGRYAYENSYTPNYEAYGEGYCGGRHSSGGGDSCGGGGCDSEGRGGGGGGD
ncbi:hypothetical protein HBH84_116700 [Parastagonospora nodorum]|nr:hypothetical protein HBH84_116700 [Parastagonospora nodorum]